jgi:hypothetical protein
MRPHRGGELEQEKLFLNSIRKHSRATAPFLRRSTLRVSMRQKVQSRTDPARLIETVATIRPHQPSNIQKAKPAVAAFRRVVHGRF